MNSSKVSTHQRKFNYRCRQRGLTVIELLIVIVVIGILAGIGISSYNNMQRSAASSAVASDIKHITTLVERRNITDGSIPPDVGDLIKTSPDVQVVYVSSASGGAFYYGNLQARQNGLLFYNHCRDMVNEGLGNGPNDFGTNTVAYISGCYVYGKNYLQINGWNGGFKINDPSVTEAILQSYAERARTTHPSHPSYSGTLQAFMDELIRRFTSEGGTFPITEFWDPWVGVPTLPPPTTHPDATLSNYCIIATHTKFTDVSYVVTSDNLTPRLGSTCG